MTIPDMQEALPEIATIVCAVALIIAFIIRLQSFSSNTLPSRKTTKKSTNTKKEKSLSEKSSNPLSNKKITEQQRKIERESITGNVTTEIFLMDSDSEHVTRSKQPEEIDMVSITKTSSHEPSPSSISQPTNSGSSGARSGGDHGGGGSFGGSDTSSGSSE